jgi:hypothetical protein
MQWDNLGPSQFRPKDAAPSYFFVPVWLLRKALDRMGASLEQHGDAMLLMIDDRACRDPVYLPPPVRGFYGYPTIEKLCSNSPINVLDLCMRMKEIAAENADGTEIAKAGQPPSKGDSAAE